LNEYVLEIENITKTFPGVRALDNVCLRVRPGTVHALVGENGAGKSTLMKILYGNYRADSGKIRIDGSDVNITSPILAEQLGLSIIFQELNLIPELTAGENIFLGRLEQFKSRGRLDWKRLYRKAAEVLALVGADIDPRASLATLSMAQRQMIEIAKALSRNAKIILMDEPSATLTDKELQVLFRVVREYRSRGVSFIYISHRLEEIFEVCDEVTVIRDGRVINSHDVADVTRDKIISEMVGRELSQTFPVMEHQPGEELLRVEGITRKGVVDNVSFSVCAGEVLGIAGLVGAGRTEVCRMIFGADYLDSGKIFVRGREVKINSPQEAIHHGIAYLPEERKRDGVILPFTVAMNMSATNIPSIMKGGLLNRKLENDMVAEKIKALNIKTTGRRQKVGNLSGGNQQKIVVGKWLNTEADVFIFDEPTRGIDVGAKYEIYQIINQLIKRGKAVILISSELPEVLSLSRRVLVMQGGQVRGELQGDAISANNVMALVV